MTDITLLPPDRYGYDFIPPLFLPPGKDEYWRRNEQQGERLAQGKRAPTLWRRLKAQELEVLAKNGNSCSDWNNFYVTDPFDPSLVRNSAFYGMVRLGKLRRLLLKHHDFCVPSGIRNSTIISCDIGDDTVIQDCSYLSHYIIGDQVILSRIDEMQTTNHAKFGNGVLKPGEGEDVRVWIDVMNEAGGRSVLPFQDMIPADAFLWASYRDDTVLVERLKNITQETYGGHRGDYGIVGSGTVIKSCVIIKDLTVGECAYIKGAHKLKNLTILSSEEEPSQIGEGVEMVNGIVGYGCHSFYSSKAVRFVMGRNSNLKYGARLIHSVLGDNSTVSCCEMLNNLIFPIHEQHHNNSFLIASLVQGMSNMAAGANVGSNHNSRANDGEIRAGRGFWPGLSVTLKHSSRFASFVLIAKGDYPYELNITLPFSMVNNNQQKNRLEVMPAYYWLHNLYALERNSRKSRERDRRVIKEQHIETNYLAPDTAEEIISALVFLDACIAQAGEVPELPVKGLERGKRDEVILKPLRARNAYKRMLHFYAVRTLAEWFAGRPDMSFPDFLQVLGPPGPDDGSGRVQDWINMGGQLVPAFRVDRLRQDIREGNVKTWDEIHRIYAEWQVKYAFDRLGHAWEIYCRLLEPGLRTRDAALSPGQFEKDLEAMLETKRWITGQVYASRAKDFHDSFRHITYRSTEEMEQVGGKLEENPIIIQTREELLVFEEMVQSIKNKLGNP